MIPTLDPYPPDELVGWAFPQDVWECLSPYERSFVRIEFTGGMTPEFYKARLRSLGFSSLGSVLDAGCGMGQWAITAASLNDKVVGIDISTERLLVARTLAEAHSISNLRLAWAPMESLPVEDGSQDAILCYGAFMFSRMKESLAEFRRVLAPGGVLYLTASSFGWYAHLLIDRGIRGRQRSMIRASVRGLFRTVAGFDKDRIVGRRWLARTLREAGFEVRVLGPEGSTKLVEGEDLPDLAYPEKIYGLPARLEVVASLPSGGAK